ncbi:MAG: transposase, partial [Planctomycetes bacterium]|nr:transposase [Planctomycetota bacterium]
DPRGSYSKGVYNEELRALGPILPGRQSPHPAGEALRRFWTTAVPALGRQPFFISDATRPVVAQAFESVVRRLATPVVACAIMNDHVHMVVLRRKRRIEYVVNQLKGAATRALGLTQTPWTRGAWKVFLDDPEALRAAIEYVQANPPAAGLPAQHWDFVRPVTQADIV